MTDRGNWVQTYTGRRFYPLDPRPSEVDALDIAHALSLICRYGGHVSRFYSVAEHCVLMSQAVAPEFALWALLHDATEAYVGDMVRPLKHHLPEYVAIEDGVMRAVATSFGLDFPPRLSGLVRMPDAVKEADSRILLDERAELMRTPAGRWECDHLEPLGVKVRGWDPLTAEVLYLARLGELTGRPTVIQ